MALKFACGEYDRAIPFRTGNFRAKGIDLDYTPQALELTSYQQLKGMHWDVSEMSKSTYVQMREIGRDNCIALPAFSSRVFRHSAHYVPTNSEIRHPEQLRGKLMDVDYWLFGVRANSHCIKTFVRHLKDQEIIDREPDVSTLFLDLETIDGESVGGAVEVAQ